MLSEITRRNRSSLIALHYGRSPLWFNRNYRLWNMITASWGDSPSQDRSGYFSEVLEFRLSPHRIMKSHEEKGDIPSICTSRNCQHVEDELVCNSMHKWL